MKRYHKIFSILVLAGLLLLNNASLGKPDTQFDFLSFIKSAFDAYNKIKNFLEPDPNFADLILQAMQEILDEINLVRAEEQIANVEALIEEYAIYLNNPPSQQTIEAWIRDAINVVNQFEIIIESPDKSARIAYLCARSYNMLIPLMTLMMQRHGIRTADILPLFEDAITTNQALLGQYCWDELPNAPIYRDRKGKLSGCLYDGIIDSTEYETIYDIVWTANEEMRKNTIDRYDEMWFYISNERGFVGDPISPDDNKYLCAHSRPNRTDVEVTVADLREGDSDFLWRLEFQTAFLAKIRHWSGKYLAQALYNEPNTWYMDVIISPRPEWRNEYWKFSTFYADRPSIINNVIPPHWHRPTLDADTQGNVCLDEMGRLPGEGQRWIILFATRQATGIGSFAFPCPADYDGDNKADLGMKINDGRWLIDFARNGFGNWDREITTLILPSIDQYAQPAAADYDGDGQADIAIKHDVRGVWYIDFAANGYGSWDWSRQISGFSNCYAYHAVPADYDGDGKADIALFQNTGAWSIDFSGDTFNGWDSYPHSWEVYYPSANLYPAPADYDGDGKADVSVKSDDGKWLIDFSHNGFVWTNEWDYISSSVNYGNVTAYPLPGHYSWDQFADIGVRTDDGQWKIEMTHGGIPIGGIDWTSQPIFGGKNSFPIPADYDGDGMTDLSVIEENGTWLIDYSGNGYGSIDWSSALSFPTAISSPEPAADPSSREISYRLLSNYPNPFNGATQIHYSVRQSDDITIKIYNLLGAEVATLVDEHKAVGEYTVTWDGRDRQGIELPSGIYLCKMHHRSLIQGLKILLVK